MFTLDQTIDSVQQFKKQLVNSFVSNKSIADNFTAMIDLETAYAKGMVRGATDTANAISKELVESLEQAKKFDFIKINEAFVEKMSDFCKYPKTSKKSAS